MRRVGETFGRWTGRRFTSNPILGYPYGGMTTFGTAAEDLKAGALVYRRPDGKYANAFRSESEQNQFDIYQDTVQRYRAAYPEVERHFNDTLLYAQGRQMWADPQVVAQAGPDLWFIFRRDIARSVPLVTLNAISNRYAKEAKQIAGGRPILRVTVGKHEKMTVLCRDYDRRIVRRTAEGAVAEEADRKLQEAVLRLFEAPLHLQRDPPAVQPFPSVLD